MASLVPEHGARIVLERLEAESPAYTVHVYEAGGAHHEAVARLSFGELRFGAWSSEPPAWVVGFATRLLLGLVKKHGADGSWPRKITRWRDASG